VLAYTEGEEAFIDANGNNQYDAGETFFDMGQPFLDSNENGVYDATSEQKIGDPSIPGAGIGSTACAAHPFLTANVANTCDGQWGGTRVRGELVIVFSTSFAAPPTFFNVDSTGLSLTLSDQNGNAMPKGTIISAALSGGTHCSLVEVIPPTVANGTNPTVHRVIISKGSDPTDTCSGVTITPKATTPKGNTTLLGTVTIP